MKMDCKISLKDFNSFAVETYAREVLILESESQLTEVWARLKNHEHSLILGSGSNILFRQDFPGLVVINQLKGKQKLSEDNEFVSIKAAAGENWHEFVRWNIANNHYGLENLSLIPGTVGAAPVQNIGAYGVELKQYLNHVDVIDLKTGESRIFHKNECEFSYRNSIFKTEPDRYLILSVSFRLPKKLQPVLGYAGIKQNLKRAGASENNPTALQISDVICKLRINKLPLPEKIGNAGSFFKNPIANCKAYTILYSQYPDMPVYKLSDDHYKIPAAWLIEQCGWKGFRDGDVGVYDNHALVLVNHGQASGEQLWQLANKIQLSVLNKFDINLEPELRII